MRKLYHDLLAEIAAKEFEAAQLLLENLPLYEDFSECFDLEMVTGRMRRLRKRGSDSAFDSANADPDVFDPDEMRRLLSPFREIDDSDFPDDDIPFCG